MRKIVCFCFMMAGIASYAQHTATLSPKSDFKTTVEGQVRSEFILNSALTDAELNEITTWAASNGKVMTLTVDASRMTIKLSVTPDYNVRDVYDKLFLQAGIQQIVLIKNGERSELTPMAFFNLYSL
jgi:hypothetical protein